VLEVIYFVGECGTNYFGGDQFFPLQLWGSFYVILYSLFFTSYVWMDGWMVVSPAEFFHLCGWMTMLVC
jgi:hypothetical protein